ncbi:hypothetical protein [Metamycoplasma equirhinis]|uniref:hypothetical protein n=1 Tax=Metamycoplasma equirhinis TaxID=92402 RepID=UPI003593BB94
MDVRLKILIIAISFVAFFYFITVILYLISKYPQQYIKKLEKSLNIIEKKWTKIFEENLQFHEFSTQNKEFNLLEKKISEATINFENNKIELNNLYKSVVNDVSKYFKNNEGTIFKLIKKVKVANKKSNFIISKLNANFKHIESLSGSISSDITNAMLILNNYSNLHKEIDHYLNTVVSDDFKICFNAEIIKLNTKIQELKMKLNGQNFSKPNFKEHLNKLHDYLKNYGTLIIMGNKYFSLLDEILEYAQMIKNQNVNILESNELSEINTNLDRENLITTIQTIKKYMLSTDINDWKNIIEPKIMAFKYDVNKYTHIFIYKKQILDIFNTIKTRLIIYIEKIKKINIEILKSYRFLEVNDVKKNMDNIDKLECVISDFLKQDNFNYKNNQIFESLRIILKKLQDIIQSENLIIEDLKNQNLKLKNKAIFKSLINTYKEMFVWAQAIEIGFSEKDLDTIKKIEILINKDEIEDYQLEKLKLYELILNFSLQNKILKKTSLYNILWNLGHKVSSNEELKNLYKKISQHFENSEYDVAINQIQMYLDDYN